MPGKQIAIGSMHSGQWDAYNAPGRFKAIRCGRRWGKTNMAAIVTQNFVAQGQLVGYFAPSYKYIDEPRTIIKDLLDPIILRSSETKNIITAHGGGHVQFWTLEDPKAGRSRKYHWAIIDEAAFTEPNMLRIWECNIRPTLIDYKGRAMALSNTNGEDPENFFWQICNKPELGFTQYHAPASSNPYLPKDELEKLRAQMHPLVYAQEHDALFVNWSGTAFFSEADFLPNGLPVDYPVWCDGVYAIVDTATKTGIEHDGTAVTWFAKCSQPTPHLVVLDWDCVQIEGALLETWLPTVFSRGEELARQCRSRNGFSGAWIEDKSTGMVLLQQAESRGWPAHPIDSKLTAMGKDERAINVSGYVHQKQIQISEHAYRRVVIYKNHSRNHWAAQVFGYRVGEKKGGNRQDDLFDTFCYGAALGLGNSEGF